MLGWPSPWLFAQFAAHTVALQDFYLRGGQPCMIPIVKLDYKLPIARLGKIGPMVPAQSTDARPHSHASLSQTFLVTFACHSKVA